MFKFIIIAWEVYPVDRGLTRGVPRKLSAYTLPIRSVGLNAYATDSLLVRMTIGCFFGIFRPGIGGLRRIYFGFLFFLLQDGCTTTAVAAVGAYVFGSRS